MTVCTTAARMLHDATGDAVRTADILESLADEPSGFQLFAHLRQTRWDHAMTGFAAWRREGDRLVGIAMIAPGITVGDGLLILPVGRLPSETVARSLVGRAVGDLLDHAVFDGSMTITHCVSSDVTQCHATHSNARMDLAHVLGELRSGRRP